MGKLWLNCKLLFNIELCLLRLLHIQSPLLSFFSLSHRLTYTSVGLFPENEFWGGVQFQSLCWSVVMLLRIIIQCNIKCITNNRHPANRKKPNRHRRHLYKVLFFFSSNVRLMGLSVDSVWDVIKSRIFFSLS